MNNLFILNFYQFIIIIVVVVVVVVKYVINVAFLYTLPFGIIKMFLKVFCSSRLHLFDQKYNTNIYIYINM